VFIAITGVGDIGVGTIGLINHRYGGAQDLPRHRSDLALFDRQGHAKARPPFGRESEFMDCVILPAGLGCR
jgi:hypothetical protein